MPPQSLFRHTLHCPSSPYRAIDLSILDSLHYPNSLKPISQLRKENQFFNVESDSELCFSIDDYGDFGGSFFYKNCPSVYCATELDASKRLFTLPSVLSVCCANFVCDNDARKDCKAFMPKGMGVGLGILPSDLFFVRKEVEGWSDFPCLYSFRVLRVVLVLGRVDDGGLLTWVILNSPRYGIVIDVYMRDHVCLLMRLCLKAILLEGYRLNEVLMKGGEKEGSGGFSCPVLVEAMAWLASQLSVLYGEVNGRLFALNVLKHCILNAASKLSDFPSGKKEKEVGALQIGFGKSDGTAGEMSLEIPREKLIKNVKIEEPIEEGERGNSFGEENSGDGGLVFVSQVAAAIAALHERLLLEEKIKRLRVAGFLSKSQRLTEHSYVTMRADEERRKRSNYRPILEHDGLLWHRSNNQDFNKNKTREEQLAEERDYKRRRMSYRGKKLKRSRTEVMRDIIEVHMEEIKQAGGIGCFANASAESEVFPPESLPTHEMNVDKDFRKTSRDSPEPRRGISHGYRKQLQEQQRRASRGHREHLEDHCKSSRKETRDRDYRSRSPEEYRSRAQSNEKHRHRREHNEMEKARSKNDKYNSVSPHRPKYWDSETETIDHQNGRTETQDREYRSRSPEAYRSHARSYEEHRHRREHDEMDKARSKSDKHYSISLHRSKYSDKRSFSSVSNSSTGLSDWRHEKMLESKGHYKGESRRSGSVTQTMFEDRYDPSESESRYEDPHDEESFEKQACQTRQVV